MLKKKVYLFQGLYYFVEIYSIKVIKKYADFLYKIYAKVNGNYDDVLAVLKVIFVIVYLFCSMLVEKKFNYIEMIVKKKVFIGFNYGLMIKNKYVLFNSCTIYYFINNIWYYYTAVSILDLNSCYIIINNISLKLEKRIIFVIFKDK